MVFKCNLCSNEFGYKRNLSRHLANNSCKINCKELDKKINELQKTIEELRLNQVVNITNINNIDNSINNTNNIDNSTNVNIVINPINEISLDYMDLNKIKNMLIDCDDNNDYNYILANLVELVEDILCDPNHTENHCVKYINKRPLTYDTSHKDIHGKIHSRILGLSGTISLIHKYIRDILKNKIDECKKINKKEMKDDMDDYQFTMNEIYRIIKEDSQKITSDFLQNVLANKPEFKKIQ